MRGERGRRVSARRNFLVNDPGQFPLPRQERDELLTGGVLDENDWTVARLPSPAIDGFTQSRFVDTGRSGQSVQRPIDIPRLLAQQRDVEHALILDEDLPVPVEQHATRRRQRQPPHVVVLRHLPELLVRGDLEHPERDRQRGEDNRDNVLNHGEPLRQAAAIVRSYGGHISRRSLVVSRR